MKGPAAGSVKLQSGSFLLQFSAEYQSEISLIYLYSEGLV